MNSAMFAAGCFWGVEYQFRKLKGVVFTEVGYSGGELPNPHYDNVCSGTTGHAEVVRIGFDSELVTYARLLEIFFTIHDPTSMNRQGADVGTQYRSSIFYANNAQRIAAEQLKTIFEHSGQFNNTIVTEILPVSVFYRAEEYHQRYYEKRRRVVGQLQ